MHSDTLLRAAAWFALILGALGIFAYLRDEPPPAEVVITTTTQVTTRSIPPAPEPIPIPEPEPAPEPEPEEIAYVGNVRSHKFHRLSCRYATCTNCTSHFATRDEAIDAGYRPGGCCHP